MSLGSSVTAVLLGKSHLEHCRATKLKHFSKVHVEDYLPSFILQDLYNSSHPCSRSAALAEQHRSNFPETDQDSGYRHL